jgi:hypothetical protein
MYPQRVLTGQPGKAVLRVEDDDGDPQALDAPPGVVVRDGAGLEVDNGTSVKEGATDGVYSYTLPTDVTDVLDTYTLTWSALIGAVPYTYTTEVEVVGGVMFTIGQLRRWNNDITATKYPTDRVLEARTYAEQRIETPAMVAFAPRCRRAQVEAMHPRTLLLPDPEVRMVRSILDEDGNPVDAADYRLGSTAGALERKSGSWCGTYDVVYEHGLDLDAFPIQRAAMMLAVDYLVSSATPGRATSQATDEGTFRLTIAGRDGPTGLPEVDAVIEQYGRVRPAVGAGRG